MSAPGMMAMPVFDPLRTFAGRFQSSIVPRHPEPHIVVACAIGVGQPKCDTQVRGAAAPSAPAQPPVSAVALEVGSAVARRIVVGRVPAVRHPGIDVTRCVVDTERIGRKTAGG